MTNLRDADCCGACIHCDIDPYERRGECMNEDPRISVDSHSVCDSFEAYEDADKDPFTRETTND
jgi:hypothetical protein